MKNGRKKMDTLNKNEIKKLLYKQNPMGEFKFIRKGVAYYTTVVDGLQISFEVPVDDMGDADFGKEIEAKLLIRWLV